MGKFQIGDIVVANELSNGRYSVTCQSRGYRGRVVSVNNALNTIKVRGVGGFTHDTFVVDASCFDLAEEYLPIEAPEADLFTGLYENERGKS